MATLLLLASVATFPQSALAQHKTYGINATNIFEINTTTGAATSVRAVTGLVKAGLAQRASDGMIFFISGTAGNDSVYRWDPAVPAAAPVLLGRTGAGVPYLPRLAFSQGGTLYAVNIATTQLYTINQTTGAATTTGAPLTGGGSFGGDIAFAPSGTLYMMLGTNLYTVPIGGGAITLVGAVTGFAGGSTATGMAFDARGRLLVSNSTDPATIYVVPLTAGAATALGSAGGSNDLGDLGSVLAVDLRITKTHAGSFSQGQTGATYTITVRDSGNVATSGTVTVTDTLPAGLTPVSAAGAGWTCPAPVGQVVTCTRADALASSGAYPAITLTVDVSGTAPASVTNTARVSGGGEPPGNPGLTGNNAASDVTAITGQPELTVTKTHIGNFTVGVNGVYTLTVTNNGRAATAGLITVTDNLPAGLTFVSGTGAGWSCSAVGQLVTCTNPAVIAASGGTSAITLTVGVAPAAAPSVINAASVSGGGEPAGSTGNNTSAGDVTTVDFAADLGISKTDGLTAVNQGAALTYTIVVSNAGPSAVTGATVSDAFPAELSGVTWTCAASAGSSCPASGSGNLAASVDLLSGGTATFTATGTVTAGSGTITNTASVAAPAGVNDPAGNNSATDNDTQITPMADLAISKTDGITAVNQGAGLTYTIVASNAGPSAVTGATVSDAFPAQLAGVNWTCAASAGSSCPANGVGNLAASVDLLSGGTATFTVTATVTGTGTITNVATVTAPAGVNDPAGNNSATDNDTQITPTADLAITKTDGVTTVNLGAALTYTIVVSNGGPSGVTGATVTDVFPAQLSGVTWTCAASAGSSCPASGSGNLNASVDLLSGGTATFTATGTVIGGASPITNTASVTAPAGVNDPAGNNSATDNDTQIIPTADLAITKTDGVTTVNQGAVLSYTIVVSNAGPSTATGATVSDVFPAQLSGVTWTCVASAGSTCPASGSGNIATSVDLVNGGTATFTVTATVTGTGTITNTASVTAPAGTNDPAGNNSATDNNTQIIPTADLAISKTDGVTSVILGTSLTYTIVASNAGPSAVTSATVTDNFPPELSGVTWTCVASAGSSCPASGSGNLNESINLLAGGTATFTATATVTGGASPMTNVATVTAPAGTNDPAGNNSATDNDTQIIPTVDLAVTKTDGLTAVNQGASLTYTIVVSNAGPDAAAIGATVTDVFPAQLSGVTWTCAASAGSSCPASGSGNLNASIDLLVGGTATFTATATVTGTGTITNTASATAPAGVNDPPGNNSATDNNTQIVSTADLAISKTDGITAVNQGATLTYTIVASNAGPSPVTGATVSDAFPAQLSGVTWTCAASAGSSCPASGSGNLNASIDLLVGGTATFSATATVTGTGTITNVATVTAPAGTNDPAGNNSATDNNTVITPTSDLAIAKTDGVLAVNQGAALTYTIVVSNAGPSAVTGATVSDAFPAQLAGVNWTCAASAGSSCPASGSGNLAASVDLLSGGTATFTATGTVTAGSGTITNTASVAAPAGVNDPAGNNSATDNDTQITPTADLAISKTDGITAVNQGAGLTYTIVASNAGPSAVTGATVSDAFPAQLSGVTWTCAASAGSSCPANGVGNLAASVDLLSGGTATFTVTATVTGTGTITNVATVTAPAGVNDPAGNNSATDNDTQITPTADLAISKTDGVTAVNQGAALTYTIVASNAGPSAVTGATVSDVFPAQLSGVTWTCATSAGSSCPASGSGNLNASVDLLAGGTATFTATATVTGAGTITNVATVTAPAGVNDAAGNNSATDNDTQITPTADLAITKTDGVTTVNQGATLTYTIVVSNAGLTAATGATVTDAFPAQLSGVTWTCAASAGSACPASGSGNLNASVDLLVGGTATFTATGTVTAGSGTMTNTVLVTAPAGLNDPAGNNSATDNDTQIIPTADLAITKTDGVTTVPLGNSLTYTIVASNAGPSAVAGATVSDAFPPEVAGVTWTCVASAGSSCPASGSGNLNASVNLLVGGTVTFTATATVIGGASPMTNVATVTAPAGTNDPAGNNSATDDNTVITPGADLVITKTDGVTAVNQGATLTYSIVVSNAGPDAAANGATVSDVFPGQLSGVTWTCVASAGSTCPASGSGNLNASIDVLVGGTVTFTATGTVTASSGTISNTASVTAPAGLNDPPANNSATDNDTQIAPTADLAITKTDGITAVNQGAALTYTIVASNAGPSPVTGATVSDAFPAQLSGVTWTCAASAGSSCPASGSGNLNASIDLLVGGTATFMATATVTGTGTITNVATVTAPAGTNDPAGNNSATDNDTEITPTADLAITKTDGVTSVNQGAGLTYTIVVSNAGPSAVTGATVTDAFPAQLAGVNWTCAASAGSSCPASGAGNLSTAVDLLSGGTATFSASGTVAAGSGTITNTASVAAPAGVNDPAGNNSATDNDTQITPTADLAITKTDGVTAVNQGAALTYTIVVSNAGPSAVTGATVTDNFPAELSGVTWTCAATAGSSCPASGSGDIAAAVDLLTGGSATFTAMGTVTGTGTISNVATVTAPAGVNDPAGNNSATDNDTQVTAVADLAITKTDGVTSVNQGATLTYTIVVSNAGPSGVAGATVSDVFPAQLSGVTWTCVASGESGCPASGSGSLNEAVDVLAGQSVTFTVTGTVTGTGMITNTASVTAPAGINDPAAGNNSATDNDTQIVATADLAITKTDGVTAVNQGASLSYTIVISNAGPSAVTGATVTDAFPAQLAGVTWICAASAGSSCPASGSGNIAASMDLLSGGTATFTATGTVTAASGTISNTASVTAPAGVNDPAGNNSATDNDTQITPTADLAITKTDGLATVNQGAALTYTIVASNAGPSAVTGATVSDVFPAQLSGVTWTCAASAGSSCPVSGSGNLSASVDLLSGGTVTFTATGTVTAGSGTITNTSAVTAPVGVNDPAGNNSATDNDTQIVATADLAITKTDGVVAVSQGAALTYTIVVSNAGPSAVTSATVTDVFPAQLSGVTWTCAASAGSSCPASGSGNINAVVDLLASGTATFTATATVTGTGTISNVATVTAPAGVNDPAGNNSATDNDTQIAATADLAITKSDGVTAVNQGASLTYTIVASNAGPSAVTGATVSDLFPAQLSGVTWTCAASAGSSCPASGSGNLSAAVDLLSGGTATFTATGTVSAGSGTITNTASVTAPAGVNDPAGNNSATDNNTVITPTADLAITKTDGLATVNQGASLTYTIVVSNAGPSAATGATVTDNMPAELGSVSWTCAASAGSSCPASGSGNLGAAVDLLSGGTVTFTVTGTVTAASGTITNTATVTAPAGLNDPAGNNSATDNTTITSAVDLDITKSHSGTFVVATDGVYTLTVTNVGAGASTGVITVADTLPAGLGFVSGTGPGWTCGAVAQAVTCTNSGPLAPAGSSAIALTVSVGPAAVPGVTNVARVSTAGDVVAANDMASDPTTVAAVDLSVAKSHAGTFVVGGSGAYTIAVTNVGTAATTGLITVTDTLPTGLTFGSGSGAGWACGASGQVVTCTSPGSLAPAASSAITLTVGIGAQAYPSVVNSVRVATAGDSSSGGNNTAVDAATIVTFAYGLTVEKSADRPAVELADVLGYAVVVRSVGDSAVPGVVLNDALPSGFVYLAGTTSLNGTAIGDPAGAPGPRLRFAVGTIPAGGSATLTYRVRVGAGALRGDGTNRAQAVSDSVPAVSNTASARVQVEGGAFTDRGIIIGKVFVDCDCEPSDGVRQDREEVGVPGVRIYLEDGTSTVTDVEGKYNFYDVSPRLHVVKVDWSSLPPAAELIVVGNRNAADPVSRFVDLTNGELHKANFAVRRTAEVLAAVKARRAQGEVFGAIPTAVGVGAPGTGTAPVAAAGAAGYQSLLPTHTLTGANSGLPVVRLTAESLAAPLAGQGARIELVVPRVPIPADGATPLAIGVRMVDARGTVIPRRARVTLESSLGRWLVEDQDLTEPGVQAELANGSGQFLLMASPQPGAGEVRATIDVLSRTEPILFTPAARPLLAVGVVQARFSLRSLTEGALTPARTDDGFAEALTDLAARSASGDATAAARGALYLRGKIQGRYLLALSFDSERDANKRLFRDIQPDEFYPVYGDASIKEFDAQSAGPLYVRVDHDRSFVLYGDYVTPAGGENRVLSAYSRTQTGVHQHFETERTSLDAFASRGRLSQVVDEIPGQGISGPYALRRTDGRFNTEKVEILTRDRNQPSLILRSEPQTRFVDYTLEPFTGRLLFRAPVPSVDANLNPVSIRVTYEVDGGGEPFWTYGAVGRSRPINGIELGATFAREENPLARRTLIGANTTLRLGGGTYLLGEVAQSDDSLGRGNAGRLELRHHSGWLDARVFGTRSEAAFSNLSSTFGAGRGEYGGRAALTLDRHTRLVGEALRTEDRVGGGRRDGALLSVERRFGERLVVEVGYRRAEETAAPADSATVGATPNRTSAIRSRVTWQVLDRQRASIFGEFEQDLLVAQQRRGAIGADYHVARRVRLYGRYEQISSFAGPYALNGAQQLRTMVVGLDGTYLRNNQVFTEYRGRDAFSGREAEAAIGLRNRWPVGPGFVVNTSFERIQPIRGATEAVTAITGALEYTRSPLWRGTARVEVRSAPSGDNWLGTLGYARKVTRDLTFLGRAFVNTVGREQTRARTQLGFALRETDVDTWNGLARYEYRFENLALAGAPLRRTAMHIVSAQLNEQPLRSLTLSQRYAGKVGTDVLGGTRTPLSAHLFAMRALVDVTARWDAALTGSFLGSNGARSREYGLGAEVGRRVATNLRVAVGYNVFGFRDDDLTDVHSTSRGLYLDIGMKLDEGLFGVRRRTGPAPLR